MTTPRIEEMAGEVWRLIKDEWEEKDGKLPSGWNGIGSAYGSYSRLIEALTQAYQAGIDEAEEAERNRIKEWVRTQVSDGSGQCIHYEEILEALQDNK